MVTLWISVKVLSWTISLSLHKYQGSPESINMLHTRSNTTLLSTTPVDGTDVTTCEIRENIRKRAHTHTEKRENTNELANISSKFLGMCRELKVSYIPMSCCIAICNIRIFFISYCFPRESCLFNIKRIGSFKMFLFLFCFLIFFFLFIYFF